MRYGLYSVPIIPNRQHPQPPGGLAILGKGAYKLCLVSECLECYRYSQKSSLGPVCCRKKLESRLSVRLIMLSLANSTRVHPWSELHSVSIVQEKLLCCLSCMFCVYFRMFRGPTLLGWWWGGDLKTRRQPPVHRSSVGSQHFRLLAFSCGTACHRRLRQHRL